LWEPVPGDHGAHGSFDRRARDYSVEWWLDSHRGLLGLASMAGAAAALYAALKDHRLDHIYDVLEDWLPRAA
jgi:TRAP-type mannitol/chloroaromatic compound transport system permease small subunit